MTVHKAQGQTMDRVVVDLAGCTGTEAPYVINVMCSRATSLSDLAILRDFEVRQITKRLSEELTAEFNRLVFLKWQTTARYGSESEAQGARQKLDEMRKSATKGTKHKFGKIADEVSGTRKAKRINSSVKLVA